jgi:hypothetical protein
VTIDELRDAVRDFADRYNAGWLVEKHGYSAPSTPALHASTPTSGAAHLAPQCPVNRVRYIQWTKSLS